MGLSPGGGSYHQRMNVGCNECQLVATARCRVALPLGARAQHRLVATSHHAPTRRGAAERKKGGATRGRGGGSRGRKLYSECQGRGSDEADSERDCAPPARGVAETGGAPRVRFGRAKSARKSCADVRQSAKGQMRAPGRECEQQPASVCPSCLCVGVPVRLLSLARSIPRAT